MLTCNQLLAGRIWRLWSMVVAFVGPLGVAGAAALLAIGGAVRGDPPRPASTEQWGPQKGDLRTRLTPLADHFTLGQPIRLSLVLKNVGQAVIHYDTQQVAIDDSLEVRDPQGHSVRYIGPMVQTMGRSKRLVLTPGNVVFLFEQLDLNSQYLLVKPGKYSVRFRGYRFPASNTAEIDVRPGTAPPINRMAARLLEILPDNWDMTIHGYPGESDRSRPADWDDPPLGWEPVRGMPTIRLESGGKEDRVDAALWLSDRKLKWSGKVDRPGQAAAGYFGKCPEGHIYAQLPSRAETVAAEWRTLQKDLKEALEVEEEEHPFWELDVKKDDDLNRLEGLTQRNSLDLDNSEITDAGLKRLEGLRRLNRLWLSRTRVTDRGLQSLKKLPQLQHVELDGDNITDAGLENLKGLTQLQGLSLDDTKITDAGLAKLKGLTRLESLSLRNTPITDAGLEAVKGFTRLRRLNLDGVRITDAGLQGIKGLTKIEDLSLANTPITDAGLEYLKGLTDLGCLDLDETHVTDQGVTRFQRGLPRCDLFYKSAEDSRKRWEAEEKMDREAERRTSAIDRVQSIPQSKLTKHYLVQFDKAGLKRQPLLVIVWKANDTKSIGLGDLDKDVPVMVVNGHLITPSTAKKAIYALQPDYSLRQLPLTEAEIKRLFVHITRSEERAVSPIDLMTLPPDPYWEEKVDPQLKVVEPDQKKKVRKATRD